MNNNKDMSKLIAILSQMDKKELESGLSKLSTMLGTKDSNQLLDQLKNNLNNK